MRPYIFIALAGLTALASASFYIAPPGSGSDVATVISAGARAMPDLALNPTLKVTEDASAYTPTLSFSVTNSGSGRAHAFQTKVLYGLSAGGPEELSSGTQLRTSYFGLNAGASKEFFVAPLRDGIDLTRLESITITVDARQQIAESREDNNTAIFTLDSLTDSGNLIALGSQPSAAPKVPLPDSAPITVAIPTKSLVQKEANGLVHISSAYPRNGSVGTVVTLRGSGLTKTGNTVVFDSGYIVNVPSDDLTTIRFRVPADRVPLCIVSEPRCALPAPYNLVTPGEYKIFVGNRNGWSRGVAFTVVSPGEQTEDPYKPVAGDYACKDLASLLPGCYLMPENPAVRFDNTGTKYVYLGTKIVRECSKDRVVGCKSATDTVHTDTNTTTTATTNSGSTGDTNSSTGSSSGGGSSSGTSAALAFREGLYFKTSWTGCMSRLGSAGASTRLQGYLNSGQIPPPWSVFTGVDATNIANCEREAGWSGYESGGGYYGGGSTGSGGSYTATNWQNHTWRFKDGSTQFSSILDRSDAEYTAYLSSLDSSAAQGYFEGWMEGAGDQGNWRAFGIPKISPTPPAPGQQPYQYGNNTGNTTDAKAGCESAGGTWNTASNYCNMPTGSYSGGYSSDPKTGCEQAGGTWNTASNYCNMPNTGSGVFPSYGDCTANASQNSCTTQQGCKWFTGSTGDNSGGYCQGDNYVPPSTQSGTIADSGLNSGFARVLDALGRFFWPF